MQDHIVVFGTIDFDKPEFRLRPVNAISTFTVPSDLCRIAIEFRSAGISRIQPKQISVFDNRAIFQVVGRFRHRRRESWFMQLERCVFKPINQKVIHKQLSS